MGFFSPMRAVSLSIVAGLLSVGSTAFAQSQGQVALEATATQPMTPVALAPMSVVSPVPASDPMAPVPTQPVSTPTVPPVPLTTHRTWGLGTVFGGGVSAASASGSLGSSSSSVSPGILLPTFDARIFLQSGHSIDLSLPILTIAFASILLRGLLFSFDGFYNFNVGSGSVRLLIGPGLGLSFFSFSFGGSSVTGGSLRIPAMIGMEVLSASQGFGFHLGARPWAEVGVGASGSSGASALGGGVVFVIGFFGYSTEQRP